MFIKSFFILFFVFLCLSQFQFCDADADAEADADADVNDEVPVVRLDQGQIKGIKDKSTEGKEFYSYMGIPYAEPPLGKLRFKAPVPKTSWDGVLDGTKMPVSCLQTDFFDIITDDTKSVTINGREDCLHLNVFTSAPNQQEKLPVMVYIHGGGFISGGATYYHPYYLLNRDIVLVVIQYRLGIFGFLSTEDSVIPGNMGLKDQQLALKWVKENIESFGGDSNKITIFGGSAGGASVNYQILSPGSKGLFRRAILQSGTSLCPWASNKNHRKFATEAGREFGCDIDSEKYLECMQNVNPYYLVLAAEKTNVIGFNPYYVLPGVDGEFIDEAPEILMKKGKYNKVDIIQGITRDEGGLDLMFDYMYPTRRENINKDFESLGAPSLFLQNEENYLELAKQVYQYYLQREDVTVTDKDEKALLKMTSDSMFNVCHDIVANFFAADFSTKLYKYQLDYEGHVSFLGLIPGVDRTDIITHVDDMVYLFYGGDYFSRKLEHQDDLKVREIFLDLWINFAKTGNPTPSGSDFIWKEATPKSFRHLSLTTSPEMKEDDFQKKREFWSSLKTSQNLLLQSPIKEEL